MTRDLITTRLPPHNDEAEMALLGAILHNNRAFERVIEFLRPEHFANRVHGKIFEAVGKLIDRGQIADPITLKQYFEAHQDLADIGGFQYLMTLASSLVSVINAEDYGRVVYELFIRRQLIEIGEEAVNLAFSPAPDQDAHRQIETVEAKLSALAEAGSTENEARPIAFGLAAMIAEAGEARARGEGGIGLSTGFADLDRALSGLAPGNLIVLGARPSMGKTALAVSLAKNIARAGHKVGIFSLEMREQEIAQRLAADAAGIPYLNIRRGELDDRDWNRLREAERQISDLPILIDDQAGLTIQQIRARARRMRRKSKIELVIVDHLHLVRGTSDNRLRELTEISATLKEIARELDIPVLALCQLSRAVENRDDKRPQLSDLRESGSIEQDADAVAFLFRKSYYLEREQPTKKPGESVPDFMKRLAAWDHEVRAEKNVADVLIQKNRHGETGTVRLFCDLSLNRFTDLDRRGG